MSLSPSASIPLLAGSVDLPVGFILKNAYLQDGDAAFVGGSLIEGIGNRHSDVDVHVMVREPLTAATIDPSKHYRVLSRDRSLVIGDNPNLDVFLIHTVIPGTQIKVDIEYRTFVEVEQLASSVGELFAYATRSLVLLTKTLPVREMAYLHRLFNCTDISNAEYLDALRGRVGRSRFMYLMYRWKASDFSVLLDILGAWENDELTRCADLCRENMVAQFQAFSHLMGNTNYHRKWILPYASKAGITPALIARYETLLMGPNAAASPDIKVYILATLDFCDELFRMGIPLLESREEYPSGEAACRSLDVHAREDAGEYSSMEIDYRKKAYLVEIPATRNWFT